MAYLRNFSVTAPHEMRELAAVAVLDSSPAAISHP